MAKKILLLGAALLMCVGLFAAGCGAGEEIEFEIGEARHLLAKNQ